MDPLAPPAPPPSLQPVQQPPPQQLQQPALMDPPLPILPPVQASSAVPITSNFAPAPPSSTAAAPPQLATNNSSHPPYAQMITQAITALKEKNGSSKAAITKYIEQNYSNLPGTHSALLTQHLKRLKESGQLLMVKHSYKLAGSAAPHVQSNGPKRGPGRPPKPKFTAVNIQEQPQDVQATLPQQVNATAGPGPISVPESVFQSLGLVDGPVKKRPGRPKKAGGGGGAGGLQQNSVVAGKKRPGRPPKKIGGNAVLVSASGKPRGRPPKNFSASGRPRGRPPKNAAAPATVVGAAGPILVQTGYVAETATAPAPVPAPPTMAAAVPMFKKRGRPPITAPGPKKPRKLTGKPLGRPRKKEPVTAAQVSNMQHLVAYQELRSKLEFIQGRIKQTAGVLKPVLETQSAANALAAVQELEELAAVDVTAPLNLQNRQPPAPENRA